MPLSLYQTVKSAITVRQVGEMYGMEPDRHGMVCCPFHSDSDPSMKLNDTYYYCFGCGANGDAIDLTAKLFDLNPRQAAEKLMHDFAFAKQCSPQRGRSAVTCRARPLHLANARPFGRLKAPLGLSLLRCAAQTRACLWQAEQAHHTTSKEKQSVPDGERPVVHIAIVCGLWQGASGRAHPVFVLPLIF